MLTNQKQIREQFWAANPDFEFQALEFQAREVGIFSKRQNEHCATVRCAFVDFVDSLQKSGQITEKLADRACL
jgi:transposase